MSATQRYIVELEPGVWLAPWKGDPGRTLVESSARRYPNHRAAETALSFARSLRPFPSARILPVETTP